MSPRSITVAVPAALLASAALAAPAWAGIIGAFNDDVANAQTVSGTAGSVAGTTVDSTRSSSDPGDLPGEGGTVWYSWQAPASGPQQFTAKTRQQGDSTIGVYTGTVGDLSTIVTDDDGGSASDGSARFAAQAGTTYLIAVGAFAEDTESTFDLVWKQTLVPSELSISGDDFPDPGTRPTLRVKVTTGFAGDRSRGTGKVTLTSRGETYTRKLENGVAGFTLPEVGRRPFTVKASWPGTETIEPAKDKTVVYPGSEG